MRDTQRSVLSRKLCIQSEARRDLLLHYVTKRRPRKKAPTQLIVETLQPLVGFQLLVRRLSRERVESRQGVRVI